MGPATAGRTSGPCWKGVPRGGLDPAARGAGGWRWRRTAGVRQRWLLVESEERARLAEEELNRRVARAEGEAQKVLGQLTARSFACEADPRGALAEASARLPFHRLVHLGVQERKRGRVGRPPKGEPPLSVGYRLLARLGS